MEKNSENIKIVSRALYFAQPHSSNGRAFLYYSVLRILCIMRVILACHATVKMERKKKRFQQVNEPHFIVITRNGRRCSQGPYGVSSFG